MATARSPEIRNITGQLKTNCVTDRAASLDEEQHVMVQRQRWTRDPTTRRCGTKPGEPNVPPHGAWTHLEPVMLPHIGQLDKKLTNSTKNSAASETPVTNENSISGPEKDSNSTMHFPLMPSYTGRTLGIVGNVGEGLESRRRSALALDPRASSTADGSMRELQDIGCLSDAKANELFDRISTDTSWWRKAAIHHHVCEQVGPVRKRSRRGSGHRQSQSGCGTRADRCSARQLRRGRAVLALEKQSHGKGTLEGGQNVLQLPARGSCQTPFASRARDLRKMSKTKKHLCAEMAATAMNTGAVVEGIPSTFSSSHGYVFAATKRWKRLVVIVLFIFIAGKLLHAVDPRGRHGPRNETSCAINSKHHTTAMTMWDDVMVQFLIVSVRRLTIRCNQTVL